MVRRLCTTASILNGALADPLTGGAPIVLHKLHRVRHRGDADQPIDSVAKDDVADHVADAALDAAAPRFLRTAGDAVGPRVLATSVVGLEGRRYKPSRAGGVGLLGAAIRIVRTLPPGTPFPAWRGARNIRDVSGDRGKPSPLDNDRRGKTAWTRTEDVLAPTIRPDQFPGALACPSLSRR